MADTATRSDKSFGLGLAFGLLGIAGALAMFVFASDQLIAGSGFALAVAAGSIAVVAIHAFD